MTNESKRWAENWRLGLMVEPHVHSFSILLFIVLIFILTAPTATATTSKHLTTRGPPLLPLEKYGYHHLRVDVSKHIHHHH